MRARRYIALLLPFLFVGLQTQAQGQVHIPIPPWEVYDGGDFQLAYPDMWEADAGENTGVRLYVSEGAGKANIVVHSSLNTLEIFNRDSLSLVAETIATEYREALSAVRLLASDYYTLPALETYRLILYQPSPDGFSIYHYIYLTVVDRRFYSLSITLEEAFHDDNPSLAERIAATWRIDDAEAPWSRYVIPALRFYAPPNWRAYELPNKDVQLLLKSADFDATLTLRLVYADEPFALGDFIPIIEQSIAEKSGEILSFGRVSLPTGEAIYAEARFILRRQNGETLSLTQLQYTTTKDNVLAIVTLLVPDAQVEAIRPLYILMINAMEMDFDIQPTPPP